MKCIFCVLTLVVLGCPIAVAADGFKSTNNPRFDAAVHKAVDYLNKVSSIPEKEHTFVAYALFKAGEPATSPHVASGIQAAEQRSVTASYSGYDHIYLAGVDAMLLSDVDAEKYATNLQAIVDYVSQQQKPEGGWSDTAANAVDTSMTQYALLAIWAAIRAGAKVSPEVVERAAIWHMKSGNSDGGWSYRPGTQFGDGSGNSTHTMSMAGSGSLAICRTLFYGPVSADVKKVEEPPKKFGVLESAEDPAAKLAALSSFPNYKPSISAAAFDERIRRGFQWNETRFEPVCKALNALYFYYALERGVALAQVDKIAGRPLYESYGEGLLTMQVADGSFKSAETPTSGTCFAILFFMRSTKGIIDKQYGLGLQLADRGNPFGEKKKKEPTELDRLIEDISKMDIPEIDESSGEVADEIVRSVLAVDDPETLVGQEDKLKSLMKHPNAKVRSAAVWALGRSGDFKLVPLMLDGIRDNSVDVNIEAIQALRFIARKPQGFGETLAPFASLGGADQIEKASPEERLRLATPWRDKALRDWSNWYFSVRPFEDRGGIEELQLAVPQKGGSADIGEPAKK